ncbi:30S ribosomal protein S2 [Candidatus Daviesbacteria bacterium]|nr:30S ribosomal protein S2 [Candidatus Daviesbacteria bacterium]
MSAYKLPTLQELLVAGVHFGHQVRRGHPRMKPYIYGAKDGVHIIDLTKTEKLLKETAEALYNFGKEGKTLLLVGTKKQARAIIEEAAQKAGAPYLTERWVGGFLTNFDEVFKNIKKLKELKEQKEKGQLKKYTKKEQLLISRKIEKLEQVYKGCLNMEVLPGGVFVADAVTDEIATKEAGRLGIKVFAIADSNADPTRLDHFVTGNDDAIKSIKILVECLIEAYSEGKKEAGKIAEKAEQKRLSDEKKAADEELPEEIKMEVAAAEEQVEKAAVKESEKIV